MKRAAGFTLIEILIATVLLSFITVIGYQGLIFGIEQWHKGHERMQFRYDYQQAIGWARTRLGTAERAFDSSGDNQSYLFNGDSQTVEFVTRFDRARRAGLYVTRLFLDERDRSLYVSYYPHHPDIAHDAARQIEERVKLLTDVVSLRISYYGRTKGSRHKDWHSGWRKQTSLPQLIKLQIGDADGNSHVSLISVLTSNNV